jgi:D-amino-acid dehydrogenase
VKRLGQKRTAIVIGAGVVGMATAYALVRKDWRVTIVDQEGGPGRGVSYANGGQLSYCYTDALASPSMITNWYTTLFKSEGLGLSPHADSEFARWVVSFLRNCTAKRFRSNTMAGLHLAKESRLAMERFLEEHPIEFGRRAAGKLHIYYSAKELARASTTRSLKESLGYSQSCLSLKDALAIEPALESASDQIAGAIFTPSEEIGDAHLFCREMLALLKTKYGVNALFGQAVESLEVTADGAELWLEDLSKLSADKVVICAAAATKALLSAHGGPLPIEPMKGYSFEMPLTEHSPKVSLTDTKRKIVFTNLGDRMRVAGFADLGNRDPRIDPEVADKLVAAAQAALPKAGNYDEAGHYWAGLRPMTPNSLPIIARPKEALAVNTGHGMLGWTMAMGSGERLAELLN